MKVATGEYKDGSFGAKRGREEENLLSPPFIILIIMAIIVMRGFRGRGNHHSIGHNMPIWPFLFMGGLGGFGGGSNNDSGGGFGGGNSGGLALAVEASEVVEQAEAGKRLSYFDYKHI